MAMRRQQPAEVLLEQGEAAVGWLSAQTVLPAPSPAIARWAALVDDLASTLATPTAQRPVTLDRLASRYPAALGRRLDAAPVEDVLRAWPALSRRLSGDPLPATVVTPVGPAATDDVLGLHLVALVLTLDDLRDGVAPADAVPLLGPAAARSTRTLTAVLAARHPGRSVEVRIPPYAAVQCGIGDPGPRHTRGTPPNVVETDALTFRSLAAGRLSWPAALASGRVHASGLRADLSTALPLVGNPQDQSLDFRPGS